MQAWPAIPLGPAGGSLSCHTTCSVPWHPFPGQFLSTPQVTCLPFLIASLLPQSPVYDRVWTLSRDLLYVSLVPS